VTRTMTPQPATSSTRGNCLRIVQSLLSRLICVPHLCGRRSMSEATRSNPPCDARRDWERKRPNMCLVLEAVNMKSTIR
jgi:hypothetical protein